MLCRLAAIVVSMSCLGLSAVAGDLRTFGGRVCYGDCSEHANGCRIAEQRGFTDIRQCRAAPSAEMEEGCTVYVEDPLRGCDDDDEGREIGP